MRQNKTRSSNITVEYEGREISFDEIEEEWVCYDLGCRNVKLSALKTHIDDMNRTERALNVPALMIKSNYGDQTVIIERVLVTILCDSNAKILSECWVKSEHGHRQKVYLHDLIPVENGHELRAWAALHEEAVKKMDQASKCLDDVPRHDADSLTLLAKAKVKVKEKAEETAPRLMWRRLR